MHLIAFHSALRSAQENAKTFVDGITFVHSFLRERITDDALAERIDECSLTAANVDVDGFVEWLTSQWHVQTWAPKGFTVRSISLQMSMLFDDDNRCRFASSLCARNWLVNRSNDTLEEQQITSAPHPYWRWNALDEFAELAYSLPSSTESAGGDIEYIIGLGYLVFALKEATRRHSKPQWDVPFLVGWSDGEQFEM
jgi:hypothetical protein